jgi:hypothetical protein
MCLYFELEDHPIDNNTYTIILDTTKNKIMLKLLSNRGYMDSGMIGKIISLVNRANMGV